VVVVNGLTGVGEDDGFGSVLGVEAGLDFVRMLETSVSVKVSGGA